MIRWLCQLWRRFRGVHLDRQWVRLGPSGPIHIDGIPRLGFVRIVPIDTPTNPHVIALRSDGTVWVWGMNRYEAFGPEGLGEGVLL